MDIIEYREFCLSLRGATECTPFDEDTLVMKVGGRMFTYASMGDFRFFNAKCDPQRAIELRGKYPDVRPGYHASKVHWNSVYVDGLLTETFLREQITNSYALVKSKLPRATRDAINI